MNGGLHFQLNDWLGTRRATTNYAGVVEQTCARLPYGDQLNCTASQDAPNEQHFTGKIHDSESGLDYFGARYYSENDARFMSPDWSAKVEPVPYAKLGDPQSLNLYGYMLDSPLDGVDQDGHNFILLNDSRAVGLNGHSAVLVGSNKAGWTYYSKKGYFAGNYKVSFKTLSAFQKSKYGARYNRAVELKTSAKQDKAMIAVANKDYNMDYSLIAVHGKYSWDTGENCADLTAEVGKAGGVHIDTPSTSISIAGSSFSVTVPATNPNSQFMYVILNNQTTAIVPHVGSGQQGSQ